MVKKQNAQTAGAILAQSKQIREARNQQNTTAPAVAPVQDQAPAEDSQGEKYKVTTYNLDPDIVRNIRALALVSACKINAVVNEALRQYLDASPYKAAALAFAEQQKAAEAIQKANK